MGLSGDGPEWPGGGLRTVLRRPDVHRYSRTFLKIAAGDSVFYPLSGPSRTKPGAYTFYFLNDFFCI